jgi:hypothetical protein
LKKKVIINKKSVNLLGREGESWLPPLEGERAPTGEESPSYEKKKRLKRGNSPL